MKVLQTSALPLGYVAVWSGRRDSNSRPSPWQGDTPPLSHSRIFQIIGVTGFEPATSWSQTRRSSQAEPHPVSLSSISVYSVIRYSYIPSKPHIELPLFLLLPTFHPSYPTSWLSPRPISNSQLHALLHFHLCPIYLVVFKGSYYLRMGYLILRGASRLDAFSVYPVQTWLPCHGLGKLTGTPAVCPSRSSRTKDSSSQISYARAG